MKMGNQRGSTSAAAVLETPETNYASTGEPAWRGQEPAPAGALQRGYAAEFPTPSGYGQDEEEEYRPRRGASGLLRPNLRSLMRSVGGRIVLGVTAFVLLVTLVAGFAAARYYVLHDPRFVISTASDIQISGNEHLTRAQILSVFGGDLERNIFHVSLGERRKDLENLPWIEHATVMRLLPNQIRVQVVERTPVAYVRQGTQIGLVDAGGVLLDIPQGGTSAGERYSFPVMTGIVASDPLSTRAARMEVYGRFVHELDGKGQHLTKAISEVDVTDPEDVKALLESGSSEILVHFGDDQFLNRYNEFESHLAGWKQQYPKLASVDMRYDGQIVLEMMKGEAGATTVADIPGEAKPIPAAKAKLAVLNASVAKPVVKAVVASVAKPVVKPVVASVAKPVAIKTVAPKPTVATAVSKPLTAPKVIAPKPLVAVAMAKPATAPRVVAPKVVAAKKPATKKPVLKKVAAKVRKPVTKPAVAHASGSSSSNEKMFAALAAQRKAAQASGARP
jgi:cell division protein FtsQ